MRREIPWLTDATLRVDQGNALALIQEACGDY